jgi:hypothetical protein
MKIFYLCFFLVITQLCLAQTYVTVIGTQHQPTDRINSNDLYRVLNKIKPDVILMELEGSTMSPAGEFLTNSNELEPTAVKRLQKNYAVILRPFDYKDRNKFYADNKVFARESGFFHTLDSVYNNKLMDSLSLITYQHFISVNNILNSVFAGNLKEINSQIAEQLCKLRQDFSYSQTLNLICYRNTYMRPWASFWKMDGNFWTFRNETMVDNIINYCREFKNKKIVVLTGAMHKYFLTDGLQAKQKQEDIVLKEFWEYEDR